MNMGVVSIALLTNVTVSFLRVGRLQVKPWLG
jgi:hypothetical protein